MLHVYAMPNKSITRIASYCYIGRVLHRILENLVGDVLWWNVLSSKGWNQSYYHFADQREGKKKTTNLYLLLRSQSETEFRTETSVRKPSIRASYRHLGSYIWWSIWEAQIAKTNLLLSTSTYSAHIAGPYCLHHLRPLHSGELQLSLFFMANCYNFRSISPQV